MEWQARRAEMKQKEKERKRDKKKIIMVPLGKLTKEEREIIENRDKDKNQAENTDLGDLTED